MIIGGLIGLSQEANTVISAQAVIGGLALIFVRDAIAGIKNGREK